LRVQHAVHFIGRHGCRHSQAYCARDPARSSGNEKAAKQINKSAAAARKFLQENGFITKQNKVSASYR
jgi:hypothetical protein